MGIWKLQQLLHASESAFGDGFFAAGTPTWDRGVPINGSVEFSPTHDRIDDATAQSRLDEMFPGHIGPKGGTLKFTQYLNGHSTAPTGSVTVTTQYRLLQRGVGGSFVAPVGTTIASASAADTFTQTSTTGWANFTPGRVGSKGDARGDGQGFMSQGGSNSYIQLPATPNIGDVVYGGNLFYLDATSSINTERFMVMHPDTGNQYALLGCAMDSVEFNLPIGENSLPTVTSTYRVASWRRIARTYPDALVATEQACSAIAGGSVCFIDVGSSGRSEKKVASLTIRINLGLEPINGSQATFDPYQDIAGWARTRMDVDGEFAVPWETTWETWWDTTPPPSLVHKRMLATLNTNAGTAITISVPKMFPKGRRPNYPENVRDQTYVRMGFGARYTAAGSSPADSPIQIMMG